MVVRGNPIRRWYVASLPRRSSRRATSRREDARAQLVYAVELRLENPHGVFKIGMPAEARLRPER